MKKFLTGILSLALAGSMAFAFAACGDKTDPDKDKVDDGNNQQEENNENVKVDEAGWIKLFNDLGAMDSYTLTIEDKELQGLKYNGKYVTEEDQFENPMVGMMIQSFLNSVDANPDVDEETAVEKYDFVNGVIATPYDEQTEYALVDGNTIVESSWWRSSNDGITYVWHNQIDKYHGYASKAQAIAVLKARNDPFTSLIETEWRGVGEYADVKGNIKELYQIFDFNEETGIYTASIDPESNYYPAGTVSQVSFKVVNGAIVEYSYNIAIEMPLAEYLADMMDGEGDMDFEELFKGFTFEFNESEKMALSDVNSTQLSVPSNLYDKADYISDHYVIPDAKAFTAMFNDRVATDGTVSMSMSTNVDGMGYGTTVYFNESNNLLKIIESTDDYNNDVHTRSAKLYWATDAGMKVYSGVYSNEYGSYPEFTGWSDVVETEGITGDKKAALMALIPAEMQLYFNFNGKPMAEQFSQFELAGYNDYYASYTQGGIDYKLSVRYGNNDSTGDLVLYGYYISGGRTSVDVSIYNETMLSSTGGLPEVEGSHVTEEEWKALVEPWYNLKNVSIISYEGKLLVDIAADGSSGKIYNVANSLSESWYVIFNKVGDNEYTVTRYFYIEQYDEQTHSSKGAWYKQTLTKDFDDIMSTYLYMLSNFGGEMFDYDHGPNKIGDMWASVIYNPMYKGYEFSCDYNDYRLTFGNGSVTFYDGSSYTFFDKGTTVAGELPADVLAAQDEKAAIAGTYKLYYYQDNNGMHYAGDDVTPDQLVLTINLDGTFTVNGMGELLEGTWSYNGWLEMQFTNSEMWVQVNYWGVGNSEITFYLNPSENVAGIETICFHR